MGYDLEKIQISVRVSSHNDERDERDRDAVKSLETEIRKLINRNRDYQRVVVDVWGVG